jgi:hypothetical protein
MGHNCWHTKGLVAAIGGLVLTAISTAASAQNCTGLQVSVPFSFTGVEQSTVIPAGITSARVFVNGAQGGTGGGPAGGAGGLGGQVVGDLAVAPGSTVFVYVGGQGSVFNGAALGGNAGGAIGGGASDIRVGGNAVGNRVAVAGGGGGGGTTGCELDTTTGGAGGLGGGGAGGAGADNPTPGGVAGGGAGGTVGAGGAPGIGCGGFLGAAGLAAGTGGAGQACCCFGNPRIPGGGGGGGGDTVGGGGGGGSAGTVGCSGNDKGAGGGGAGGTSVNFSLAAPTVTNGVQAGNGSVEICLIAAAGAGGPIPTLSPMAILFLTIIMATAALLFMRRRRS